MRIVAVVQARLGSERLPRKVLASIGGRPALERLIDGLRTVTELDGVALAVPQSDRELVSFARRIDVPVFEGDEADVLARYVGAAGAVSADAVVRVTGDCPLLDPALVGDVVIRYRRDPCDYLLVQGYPRGLGDAEVISATALERAHREATDAWDRQHVMTYITAHPETFSVRILEAPAALRRSDLRVCVDEPADLEVVRAIVDRLGTDRRPLSAAEIIDFLDRTPAVARLNSAVRQRS